MKLKELIGGEVIVNTDEYTIYQGIVEEIEGGEGTQGGQSRGKGMGKR